MKVFNTFLLLAMSIFLTACGSSQTPELQPGTIFSGELTQVNPGKNTSADGGMIEFTISDDGESIASLSFSLLGDECWNESRTTTRSGVGYKLTKNPPPNINKNGFVWEDDDIVVKALFTSPSDANGSIAISINDMSSQLTCDYGTWDWNASVK